MRALVSLIVPVLSDADAAARLLARIAPDPAVEVVLVDGAVDPRLDELAGARPGTRLLRAPPGRGRQMNAGAAAARGDWLLFVHADSTMPPRWLDWVRRAPEGAVGGWFRFALEDEAWQARLIERGVGWRVRLLRLPYGDQGIFVRREVFARLGGFQELPLMEDVEFVRRLVKAGPVFEPPAAVITSARRWRHDGWFRRSARNLGLVSLYFAGVSPARLARWYSRS